MSDWQRAALLLSVLVVAASASDIVSTNHRSDHEMKQLKAHRVPSSLKIVSANYDHTNDTTPCIPPCIVRRAETYKTNDTAATPTEADAPAKTSAPAKAAEPESPKEKASASSNATDTTAATAPTCTLTSDDCLNGGTLDTVKCACTCTGNWEGKDCGQCPAPWKGSKCDECPLAEAEKKAAYTAKDSASVMGSKITDFMRLWRAVGTFTVQDGAAKCVITANPALTTNGTHIGVPSDLKSGDGVCSLRQEITKIPAKKFSVFAKASAIAEGARARLRIQLAYKEGNTMSQPQDILVPFGKSGDGFATSMNIDPAVDPYTKMKGARLVKMVIHVEAIGQGAVSFTQAGIAGVVACDRGRHLDLSKCGCSECPKGWKGDNCDIDINGIDPHSIASGSHFGKGSVVSNGTHAIPTLKNEAASQNTTVNTAVQEANSTDTQKAESVKDSSESTKDTALSAKEAAAQGADKAKDQAKENNLSPKEAAAQGVDKTKENAEATKEEANAEQSAGGALASGASAVKMPYKAVGMRGSDASAVDAVNAAAKTASDDLAAEAEAALKKMQANAQARLKQKDYAATSNSVQAKQVARDPAQTANSMSNEMEEMLHDAMSSK